MADCVSFYIAGRHQALTQRSTRLPRAWLVTMQGTKRASDLGDAGLTRDTLFVALGRA